MLYYSIQEQRRIVSPAAHKYTIVLLYFLDKIMSLSLFPLMDEFQFFSLNSSQVYILPFQTSLWDYTRFVVVVASQVSHLITLLFCLRSQEETFNLNSLLITSSFLPYYQIYFLHRTNSQIDWSKFINFPVLLSSFCTLYSRLVHCDQQSKLAADTIIADKIIKQLIFCPFEFKILVAHLPRHCQHHNLSLYSPMWQFRIYQSYHYLLIITTQYIITCLFNSTVIYQSTLLRSYIQLSFIIYTYHMLPCALTNFKLLLLFSLFSLPPYQKKKETLNLILYFSFLDTHTKLSPQL